MTALVIVGVIAKKPMSLVADLLWHDGPHLNGPSYRRPLFS